MTRIKICGITNIKDALNAVELGADALGFMFYEGSKRYIKPEQARGIISELPPFISTVGVFVNQDGDEIKAAMELSGIEGIQLHGDETPEFCASVNDSISNKVIKALRVKDKIYTENIDLYPVQAILFDKFSKEAYGGTGTSFKWELLRGLNLNNKIILSGGLTPENVGEAIEIVNPYAVDVSTGVEQSPGVKSQVKLRKFIEAVKNGN